MTHQVKLGTKPVNGSRGYFLCKCDECGWLGSSEEATGGDELYYCPICSAQEPDEQVGAAQVFNTMLAHIDAQAARIAQLEKDAARLDSGCIMTTDYDDMGERYQCLRNGIDLRAAIDAAMLAAQKGGE